MEYDLVVFSNVENRVVVRSQVSVIVRVGTRPFIVIELQTEHITVEKWEHIDGFLKKDWEVLQEKITRYKVVLVFHDIVNHERDCSDLVAS